MKENNAYEYHNANLTYILRSLRDNTYINTCANQISRHWRQLCEIFRLEENPRPAKFA